MIISSFTEGPDNQKSDIVVTDYNAQECVSLSMYICPWANLIKLLSYLWYL